MKRVVIPAEKGHAGLQEIVCKAVTARSFRPPHRDQIKSLLLNKRSPETEFDVIVSCHAGRNVPSEFGLPHAPEGFVEPDAECFMEIGIWIGINRKHRGPAGINECPHQER